MQAPITYEPQCHDADNVHEYVATLPKNDGIEGHEWLLGPEEKESIGVRLYVILDMSIRKAKEKSKGPQHLLHKRGTKPQPQSRQRR